MPLVVIIPEHVAHFLEVIGRLQAYETGFVAVSVTMAVIVLVVSYAGYVEVPPSASTSTPGFLGEVGEVSRDDECEVADALPDIKLSGKLLLCFDFLYLAEHGTDNLDKYLIFLEEGGLQLEHGGDTFRDGIDATVLISQDVVIILPCGFDQSNILDIIL